VNEPTIHLSGNMAAKPTLRVVAGPNGQSAVTDFRVGVTPRQREKSTDTWTDGETIWFSVTAWRGLAEHCCSSLVQGDKVLVSGRLTQRSYTAEDGSARSTLEVEAFSVGLDLARRTAVSLRNGPPAQRSAEPSPGEDEPSDDPWVSTGQVDVGTGEVRVARLSETDADVPEEDAVPV
jgi:single-strand DNA-binding protein